MNPTNPTNPTNPMKTDWTAAVMDCLPEATEPGPVRDYLDAIEQYPLAGAELAAACALRVLAVAAVNARTAHA